MRGLWRRSPPPPPPPAALLPPAPPALGDGSGAECAPNPPPPPRWCCRRCWDLPWYLPPPHCLGEGRPHLGPAPTFYLARLSGSRASSVVGSSVGPGPRRRSHRRFPPQGVPRRLRASPWWLGAQHFCRSSSQLRAGSPSRCFGQRRCSPHRSGGVGRPRAGPFFQAAWPPRWRPPCGAQPRPPLLPPAGAEGLAVGAEGLAVGAEGLVRATEGLGAGFCWCPNAHAVVATFDTRRHALANAPAHKLDVD